MSHEWKPGDVRLATVNGERMLVLRGRGIFEGNWYTQGPVAGSRLSVSDAWLLDERPLVVIDPEDREAVERLLSYYVAPFEDFVTDGRMDHMQSALREFADPTPPRIDEPGTWGVVNAACVHSDKRRPWVRHEDGLWYVFGESNLKTDNPDDWDSLVDPVLVREGVSND